MGPTPDAKILIDGIEAELARSGAFLVKELHDRIPPGNTKGLFPGDGPPTGKLKSSIRLRKVYKSRSDQWTTTVFIDRQRVKNYWYVHEAGKTITAKAIWGMIFTYRGKRWQVPRVEIKPKWYMRDSIAATEQDIALNTPPHIRAAIYASVRIKAP